MPKRQGPAATAPSHGFGHAVAPPHVSQVPSRGRCIGRRSAAVSPPKRQQECDQIALEAPTLPRRSSVKGRTRLGIGRGVAVAVALLAAAGCDVNVGTADDPGEEAQVSPDQRQPQDVQRQASAEIQIDQEAVERARALARSEGPDTTRAQVSGCG